MAKKLCCDVCQKIYTRAMFTLTISENISVNPNADIPWLNSFDICSFDCLVSFTNKRFANEHQNLP